jgi:hypothetical protein
MHFGSEFQITRMFAKEIAHASSSIAVIEKRGHQISLQQIMTACIMTIHKMKIMKQLN